MSGRKQANEDESLVEHGENEAVHLPFSQIAAWAPADAVEFMRNRQSVLPVSMWNLYVRLLSDPRMKAVWTWHLKLREDDNLPVPLKSINLFASIERAMQLPEKPGDMPKAQRKVYLDQVRKHGYELLNLLGGTKWSACSRYGGHITGTPLGVGDLASTLAEELRPSKNEYMDRVTAYLVNSNGAMRLPSSYPQSVLFDTLVEMLDWTYRDDMWGSVLKSSRVIDDVREDSVEKMYFTRSLYSAFQMIGIKIPPAHVASAANVALELDPQDELDEQSARKQIARFWNKRKSTARLKAKANMDKSGEN